MKIKWESSDNYLVGGVLATSLGILIPEERTTPTKEVLLLGGILGIVVGLVKSESTLDSFLFFFL